MAQLNCVRQPEWQAIHGLLMKLCFAARGALPLLLPEFILLPLWMPTDVPALARLRLWLTRFRPALSPATVLSARAAPRSFVQRQEWLLISGAQVQLRNVLMLLQQEHILLLSQMQTDVRALAAKLLQ